MPSASRSSPTAAPPSRGAPCRRCSPTPTPRGCSATPPRASPESGARARIVLIRLQPDDLMRRESPIVALVGPTGTGKTALSLALARRLDAEIVNCDSRQVYRGLDIGSAKPTAAERAAVPHHLYDVV